MFSLLLSPRLLANEGGGGAPYGPGLIVFMTINDVPNSQCVFKT